MVNETQVRQALTKVIDPELGKDIVSLGMVRAVEINRTHITITIALTTLQCPMKQEIADDVRAKVAALQDDLNVEITLTEMTDEERSHLHEGKHQDQQGMSEHLNKVHHVVAVMSGKGGVGKSLVTALLGTSLKRRGFRVGILDADITGPSIPKMFGLAAHPQSSPLGIIPVLSGTGIRVISINLMLQNPDQAVIWRGPLIGGAIKQFWGDVFWAELDYLLVDLPPGTADAPLTVMQSLPVNGVVLVTSPQELAGMVVRKAAHMAAQLEVPVIGLVENMSYAICPHCQETFEVFGKSHIEQVTEPLGIPLLGRIPLDPRISRLSDAGRIEDYDLPAFEEIVTKMESLVPEKAGKPRF